MGIVANIGWGYAVTHMSDGGVSSTGGRRKGGPKIKLYHDNGRTLTTTFRHFCLNISAIVPLFEERFVREQRLPPYTAHLFYDNPAQRQAMVLPLGKHEMTGATFEVNVASFTKLFELAAQGEPRLLTRKGRPFAVFCPDDHHVYKKLLEEVSSDHPNDRLIAPCVT